MILAHMGRRFATLAAPLALAATMAASAPAVA